MIGDRPSDIACARAARVTPILVPPKPDILSRRDVCTTSGVLQAAEIIVAQEPPTTRMQTA